jgi:ABC-type nitrate/sulfonate/bicarbonate transport system substrate-binding protein
MPHSPTFIRLGFVPLVDSAPLIIAAELGLFDRYDVSVVLHREVGWATIRDKIIYKELEAAHAPAGLVIAASCGLGSIATPCLTGFIFNLHGNAITLSETLWHQGVRDGRSLRKEIEKRERDFVFGVTSPFASHNFLLRSWLLQQGIHPDLDVKIVVVPPPQMGANLHAGHIDGYCVGEPWNSMAVLKKHGWIAATSSELAPGHPEKALFVRQSFAEENAPQHLALIAALIESCRFCQSSENHEQVAEILSDKRYLNVPVAAILASLSGRFAMGHGRTEDLPDFHVFSGPVANEPTLERALWVCGQMKTHGLFPDPASVPSKRLPELFRADLYQEALLLTSQSVPSYV